jgi:hypothetical protein
MKSHHNKLSFFPLMSEAFQGIHNVPDIVLCAGDKNE